MSVEGTATTNEILIGTVSTVPKTDVTLTKAGYGADAKVVGDRLKELEDIIDNIEETIEKVEGDIDDIEADDERVTPDNLLKYTTFEQYFETNEGVDLTESIIHEIDFEYKEILSVYVETLGSANSRANRTTLYGWGVINNSIYMDFYGDHDSYVAKIGVLYR